MAKMMGAAAHLLRDIQGLEDDLSGPYVPRKTPESAPEVQMLALDQLSQSPFQARTLFLDDELASLADSFLEHQENGQIVGVIQPLAARPHPTQRGRYQLAAGEKRWRAAALAGLARVPVMVKAYTDRDMMLVGLLENVKRGGLAPIDLAKAAKKLKEDFNYKNIEVAKLLNLGKSRSAYSMAVKILMLPDAVQTLMNENQTLFTAKHGRILLEHPMAEAECLNLANKVIDLGWSTRALERYCEALKHPPKTAAPETALSPLDAAQQQVLEQLGTYLSQPIEYAQSGGKHVLSVACEAHQLEAVLSQFSALLAQQQA